MGTSKGRSTPTFSRELADGQVETLKREPLFEDRLLGDIKRGVVLPTIRGRGSQVSFYYAGQKLFGYLPSGEFLTNVKFAFAAKRQPRDPDYVTEKKMGTIEPFESFVDGYEAIKGNVDLHRTRERGGLSAMWTYSHASDIESDVVVLDIEVTFSDRAASRDAIDFVLLDKRNQRLTFFEAKRWDDPRLRAFDAKPHGVIWQLQRYDSQLDKNYRRILSQYGKYVRTMNSLFGQSLPEPTAIDRRVGLFVFEYGSRGAELKVKRHINEMMVRYGSEMSGRLTPMIKDPAGIKPSTLRDKWLRGRA